jgi:ureidoglycolate lyase
MTAQPARIGSEIRTIELVVQELTPSAFAPYGVVSNAGVSTRLDFEGPVNLCEVLVEPLPLHVDFLARHVRTTQTYVPLGARESILVVAPASDLSDAKALPDLTRLAAFRLDGFRAVTLHKGTWHRTPMVDGQAAHFIVVDRLDTLDDLDLVDLKVNLGAEISILP